MDETVRFPDNGTITAFYVNGERHEMDPLKVTAGDRVGFRNGRPAILSPEPVSWWRRLLRLSARQP